MTFLIQSAMIVLFGVADVLGFLFWTFVGAFFVHRANLAMENLARRQQLAILNRKAARPRLRNRDRLFWVAVSKLWPHWRSALLIVQPGTIVK